MMSGFGKLSVDVLNPPLITIGGRNYRLLTPRLEIPENPYNEADLYPDEPPQEHEQFSLEETCSIEVEILENRKMKCELQVAKLVGQEISLGLGHRGGIKHRIEDDTFTQIKIPQKGMQGNVVIIGRTHRQVRQAALKILLLVDQARSRQPVTHFVSIPMNNSEIQVKFNEFKKKVLHLYSDSRGMDESIFQNSKKLHLTLCVCVLSDDRERQNAVEVLHKIHSEVLQELSFGGEAVPLQMKGIDYMNDDPSEVDVLYGKVHSLSWTQDIQLYSDAILNRLQKAGIVDKKTSNVKLHVTLINTRYRNENDETSNNKWTRETFDARHILKEFENFDFGTTRVSDVHLSVRYTESSDGYYKSSTKLSFIE